MGSGFRVIIEGEDLGGGKSLAFEEGFEGERLFIEAVKHQFQLLSVFGGVISLTPKEGVTAVADVIDLIGSQLGHLSHAAGGEDGFGHVIAPIYGFRCGNGFGQGWNAVRFHLGVDAKQDSVVRE